MIPKTHVRDLMVTELEVARAETSLHEAVDSLLEHRVSGLVVVDDDGGLIGVVTEQDCLRSAFANTYYQQPTRFVRDVMTEEVVTVDASADIMTAIEMFLRHPYRRLPVLDDGRLVGVLSRSDALRVLSRAEWLAGR